MELREAVNDLTGQLNTISGIKRKLEAELQALHVSRDLTDMKDVCRLSWTRR